MRVYLKLLASVILWGGTWISGRYLAQRMGPFSAALFRFVLASIFLFFFTARLEGRFPRPTRQALPWLLFLGASGIFAYNALFFEGLRTVPAGRASLIVAVIPASVTLAASLILKERLAPLRLLGIALSFCGVALILSGGDPTNLLVSGLSYGDLCIVGCVLCWTAYTLGGKKAMERTTPFASVTWSCVIGSVLLAPFALAGGAIEDAARAGPLAWANLVFLGVLATGLGFSWYYEGVKTLGASRAGVFINLVPVTAVILGVLILDEPLTPSLALGGAVVLFGVWLTNRSVKK